MTEVAQFHSPSETWKAILRTGQANRTLCWAKWLLETDAWGSHAAHDPSNIRNEAEMNDRAVVRYTHGDEEVMNIPGAPEELDVGMNQFGATKNSVTTLVAAGGPCAIIVLRHLNGKAGALVHISGENAEQDGNDHVALLALLVAAAPELNGQTQVCICFDPIPAPGVGLPYDIDEQDLAAQAQGRLDYVEKVDQHLQGLGFIAAARVTEGLGKLVYLNTQDGVVIFLDGDENVLQPPDASWVTLADDAAEDAAIEAPPEGGPA